MRAKKAKALRKLSDMMQQSKSVEGMTQKQSYKIIKNLYKSGKIK